MLHSDAFLVARDPIARDYLAGFATLHAFPSRGTQLRGIVRSNIEAETPLRSYTLAGCDPSELEYTLAYSNREYLLAYSLNRKYLLA